MKTPKALVVAGAALLGLVVVSKTLQASETPSGVPPDLPPSSPPPDVVLPDPIPTPAPIPVPITPEPTRVGGRQNFELMIQ